MKKKIIMTILGLGAGMLLFAAGARDSITIEGKLAVAKGVPTVVSGDKTWLLPAGPFYQIAWENGIKVGDSIKAEGSVMDDRREAGKSSGIMFMPTKVWVNGKEIDLSTVRGMMGQPLDRPGSGAPGMDGSRGVHDGAPDCQRPGNAGNSADR